MSCSVNSEVFHELPGLRLPGPSVSNITTPCEPVDDADQSGIPRAAKGCGEEVSSTNNGLKRVWDRRNICLYCDTPQSTLARHLERKHGDEAAVKHALSLEKGSKERAELFSSIRNRGNYAHNIQVKLGKKNAALVPWRRDTKNKRHKAHDFLACDSCKGFFFRKTLWRHKRTCSKKHGRKNGGRVQRDALSQLPLEPGVPRGYQDVLDSMVLDDISLICKTDPLIKQFGLRMYRKLGNQQNRRQYISGKLRELGRLVKKLQVSDTDPPSSFLSAFLTPEKFDAIVEAVRSICDFDIETNKYGVPSLALKLGHSLKKCALMQKASFIREGVDQKGIDEFIKLLEMEWTDQVSRQAHSTLSEEKWNRNDLLPLTEDLLLLQKKLAAELEAGAQRLREEPTKEHHRALSDVTLARVLLFNRRRQGEMGQLTTEAFERAQQVPVQPDVESTLTDFEQLLSKTLKRVEIRGKRGRGVPVLITEEVDEAIKLIIETKEAVGLERSQYVFSNAHGAPLRACDCLKKFATSCGAKHPEVITSTNLRKHIATVSQVLNLKENELDQLATFLGHDIRIHRQFYRLPDTCSQVTKISKLLMAAESGVQRHRGKNLDELQLDACVSGAGDHEGDDGENVEAPPGKSHQGEETERENVGALSRKTNEGTSQQDQGGPPSKRVKWSKDEKDAVWRVCGDYIRRGDVPGISVCTRAIAQEPALRGRAWRAVKYCCYNIIRGEKRRCDADVDAEAD